jgi:hypothetical protein
MQRKRAPSVSTMSLSKSVISMRRWRITAACSNSSFAAKQDSAFIDLGDQFLALQKGRAAKRRSAFGLVVDDKEAVRRALAETGVKTLPGQFLDFLDPGGPQRSSNTTTSSSPRRQTCCVVWDGIFEE